MRTLDWGRFAADMLLRGNPALSSTGAAPLQEQLLETTQCIA
jgi:hypothetical protein